MLYVPKCTASVGFELGRYDNKYRGGHAAGLLWRNGTDRFSYAPAVDPSTPIEEYEPACFLSMCRMHGSCNGRLAMHHIMNYVMLDSPSHNLSSCLRRLQADIDNASRGEASSVPLEATDIPGMPSRWSADVTDIRPWWYLSMPEFLSGEWVWLSYWWPDSLVKVSLFKCLKDSAFDDMCGVLEQGVSLCDGGGTSTFRNVSVSLGMAQSGSNPYDHLDSVETRGMIMVDPKLWDLDIVSKLGVGEALDEIEQKTRIAASDPFVSLLQEAEAAGRPVRSFWRQAG